MGISTVAYRQWEHRTEKLRRYLSNSLSNRSFPEWLRGNLRAEIKAIDAAIPAMQQIVEN